jgi:phage gpG-like protein
VKKKTNVTKGSKFETWESRLQNPKEALTKMGALMLAASQKAFKEQKYGKFAWRPRSVPNVFGIIADLTTGPKPQSRRFENKTTLMDKGRLKSSLNPSGNGASGIFRVGKDFVEIGSNIPYAGVHNFGGPVESLPITDSVQLKLEKWLGTKTGDKWWDKLKWLLSMKYLGKRLKMKVPARPFVGLTPQLEADIEKWAGIKIFMDR